MFPLHCHPFGMQCIAILYSQFENEKHLLQHGQGNKKFTIVKNKSGNII